MYTKKISKLTFNSVIDPNVPEDSKIRRNFAENSLIKNGYKNPPSEIQLPIGFPCEMEKIDFDETENYSDLIAEIESTGFINRDFSKKHKISYPLKKHKIEIRNHKTIKPVVVYSGWSAANKLKKFIENNCLPYSEGETTQRFYLSKNGVVYYKKEGRKSHFIPSVLRNMGTTETNKYLLESMGIKFDFPKPIELISFIISSITAANDIILDSFAGSGTTAHSILSQNNFDQQKRKFILVEMEDYADTKTAQRIKNVINGFEYKNKYFPKLNEEFDFYELGLPLFDENQNLNEQVGIEKIREYIWFSETRTPFLEPNTSKECEYFLGKKEDASYFFIYKKNKLTTLDYDALELVKTKSDQYVIYADNCLLPKDFMAKQNIIFKKIPRDITRF